ncbi:hypothetical protein [Deinococcus soli (ex Cha et al. 2016)]|uniref:Uncharacterized protein n=2 Tax=Deinococcus soli (ex Cha et al. 2016) TaxID=1309411 RepID=A0ACC6KKN5_9DEIO|nr:hypothetical protein [Deinococcus soli (ex Cha et al. 2016)]MDR6218606.1 hypothetical protein [Deinococcus soli (ex Cha et al. 2016)]MDR6328403.1 hypothetical protein [Deinococcus soli (ex Cha et al. 2016)]MDR6753014.1 hypothetical protein [Deinococcus soli (ex Cha et al. 2016)]
MTLLLDAAATLARLHADPAVPEALRAEISDLERRLRGAALPLTGTCDTCRHWTGIEGGDQQCPYTYGRCTRMQDEDYPYPHEPIVVYTDAAPYWVWTMPTASCCMHEPQGAPLGEHHVE